MATLIYCEGAYPTAEESKKIGLSGLYTSAGVGAGMELVGVLGRLPGEGSSAYRRRMLMQLDYQQWKFNEAVTASASLVRKERLCRERYNCIAAVQCVLIGLGARF